MPKKSGRLIKKYQCLTFLALTDGSLVLACYHKLQIYYFSFLGGRKQTISDIMSVLVIPSAHGMLLWMQSSIPFKEKQTKQQLKVICNPKADNLERQTVD